MNVSRQTLVENMTTNTATISQFVVGQSSTLKLEFYGNAIFNATILAKNRDAGNFLEVNAISDSTFEYSPTIKKVGMYSIDCAGYAYVTIVVNSISGGELSCYGTGVIQ